MEEAKWYVVHTFSGYENKVKADLEKTIENRGLQDMILEVSIPLEEVTEIKDGKTTTPKKKLFPAYVLVHMILNDDTWYIVRNTRGVTGFVGPGSKPVALTEEEMKNLREFMGGNGSAAAAVVPFKEGDFIVVTGGPWEGNRGAVQSVDAENGKLTIFADMFGRETPVELDFKDVKKD